MHFGDSGPLLSSTLKSRSGRRVLVNVTSLIDVVFLLLIFFMVSSTFLEQPSMELELPTAKTADLSQIKSLVLYILKDGQLQLNARAISADSLRGALESGAASLPDMTLNLFADRNAAHGRVVEVMDIARQAGIKRLMIATLPESASR